MVIGIANDHRGYELKQKLTKYLEGKGYTVIDCGTDSTERVDYTDYGFKLGELVAKGGADYGIAICGSAIGMSIALNKVDGIRCGKINNVEEAIHGKERDYINVLALSGEGVSYEENEKIVDAFLNAKYNFDDPAYIRRAEEVEDYENRDN